MNYVFYCSAANRINVGFAVMLISCVRILEESTVHLRMHRSEQGKQAKPPILCFSYDVPATMCSNVLSDVMIFIPPCLPSTRLCKSKISPKMISLMFEYKDAMTFEIAKLK